jgi:hypothetical protein
MIKKFIDLFNKNMDIALAEKTSWGRNDLKYLISKVINDTLAELME